MTEHNEIVTECGYVVT